MATEPTDAPTSSDSLNVPEVRAPKSIGHFAWLTGPKGALLGLFVGVVGLIWGFVSYFLSVQRPELSFAQQPVQAVLLRAGEVTKLSVTHDGVPVTTDITATQIAIWNAGNSSIRVSDILAPIRVQLPANVAILEARVRQMTRDVIGFRVTVSDSNPNTSNVEFRILEPGDGAIVQLIYAGKPGVDVTMPGVLVGQKSIRKALLLGEKEAKYEPKSPSSRWLSLVGTIGVVVLALGAIALGSARAARELWRHSNGSESRSAGRVIGSLVLFAFALGVALLVIYLLFDSLSYVVGPPFNF